MVDKDEIIKDFLTTLKVAFKTATIYKMDHPAFQKTVDDLMAKIRAILTISNPLSISFTPNSLYLDNKFWEKEKTYVELARLFHFRKIKTLEIRQGITLDELMRFASNITLPLNEFIKQGGAQNILKKEKIQHVSLDVLDYSQLLKGEGEEIKDIWPYLLMEAVEENDNQKLSQMAESFERIIGKFNTEDLIKNEELQKSFFKFFKYLKESVEEKYRTGAKGLLKTFVAGKKTAPESKFDNLKLLFSGLSEEDLASTLWEEIIGDDKFDSFSFNVFSKIIDKERHLKISSSLRNLFQSDNPVNKKPEVEQKIRFLLSGTSSQYISEIYRQTLANLLDEISFEQKISFDHHLLKKNYRFMLLNILEKHARTDQVLKVLERILEEWNQIAEDKDLEYLKCLLEVLQKKEKDLTAEPTFQKTRRLISESLENRILRGESSPDLDYFIQNLKESIFDRNAYLEKIFRAKTITPSLLGAFFGFFPQYLFEFKAYLKQKASDSRLLENIVDNLKFIDTPISLVTLKNIFLLGSDDVKIRVLRSMQNLTEYDEKFLFGNLETKSAAIKTEVLILLMRNEKTKHVALNKLLNLESPYGIRNRKIISHIKIVEEKNLREAKPYLESLTRRKNFWNRRVRETASRVLEKWGER